MLKLALGLILATSVAANAQCYCNATDPTCGCSTFGTVSPENFRFSEWSTASQMLAMMDVAGNVSINWNVVEQAAKEPNNPSHFYARLFLAIRDKTYKDLP